jgi:hypothetical protein
MNPGVSGVCLPNGAGSIANRQDSRPMPRVYEHATVASGITPEGNV